MCRVAAWILMLLMVCIAPAAFGQKGILGCLSGEMTTGSIAMSQHIKEFTFAKDCLLTENEVENDPSVGIRINQDFVLFLLVYWPDAMLSASNNDKQESADEELAIRSYLMLTFGPSPLVTQLIISDIRKDGQAFVETDEHEVFSRNDEKIQGLYIFHKNYDDFYVVCHMQNVCVVDGIDAKNGVHYMLELFVDRSRMFDLMDANWKEFRYQILQFIDAAVGVE